MEPAAYVLFDELCESAAFYRSILTGKSSIPIRLLGRLSGVEQDSDLVEILSPTRGEEFPSVTVSVKFLSDEVKRDLYGSAAMRERLVQFLGDLSLSSDQQRFQMNASFMSFMDGVDMAVYKNVVQITRPYMKHLPAF